MKKQKKNIITINSHEKPHFLKKNDYVYPESTTAVPRFENKKKILVRHGCVPYVYRTSTGTHVVPGTGTFCKLEYPCFRVW